MQIPFDHYRRQLTFSVAIDDGNANLFCLGELMGCRKLSTQAVELAGARDP
jgi:hypothetical protein